MDSLVASAARLLAAGDPLGALKPVALRDDPPALALRTLPGHGYRTSVSMTSAGMLSIRRPMRFANCCVKWRTN